MTNQDEIINPIIETNEIVSNLFDTNEITDILKIKKRKREKRLENKKKKKRKVEKIVEIVSLDSLDSIKENFLSWTLILITVSFISSPNVICGLFTFFICFLSSYYLHYESHKSKNIFTIIHNYHHDNSNFFSHFTQVLLEFACGIIFLPFFLYKKIFLNIWVLIYFVFFYSTIHNINYGILHVNNVHRLHHECLETNIGPDICDIFFGTKNTVEKNVENTNHYIPNILFCFFFVLLLQFLWKNDNNKNNMIFVFKIIVSLTITILIISSFYLWFTYDIGVNKEYLLR